jgi:type I restriction enzyme R subunit
LDADFKPLRFEIDAVDYGTALLRDNRDAMTALRDAIVDQVSELPLGVNVVAAQRDLIDAVVGGSWWASVDDAKLRDLVARLGPLMRFRQQRTGAMVSLNLADITAVHERVIVGPDGRDMPIVAYRQRVEDAVRSLLSMNPVLQRIQGGAEVTAADLRELAGLLGRQDPMIDEDRLRKAYDVRSASFLQLMRHILGVQSLERWPTLVTREFDRFISEHTMYTALQLRFLQTLRTFMLQRRQVGKRDLVESPFTQLHPQGVRGVFTPGEIDEILRFTGDLAA